MIIESAWFSWLVRLIPLAWEKIRRPLIRDPRAPVNLFEHAQPYASLDHLREVFGTPYRSDKQWITYRFQELFLQITTKDLTTVETINVLIRKRGLLKTFQIYPLQYILGKITLSDVMDSERKLTIEGSSKYCAVYTQQFFGFPGKYNHYTFGIYSGPGIHSVDFEVTPERDGLASDPKKAVINWVHIGSSAQHFMTPDFYHFI